MTKPGLLLCLILGLAQAHAQETPEDSLKAMMAAFEARLTYQRGDLTIGEGLATLHVPEEFRYLSPEQADLILVNAWGNPPGRETLGMLLPSDISPLSPQGWGVIISYEEEGYVKDDDAESIDYNELLTQMQEDAKTYNEERVKEGYEPVALIGWAAPPHYDKAAHKLYWAKELKFGEMLEHTLNYNIRVLGRKGVLVLNAVSTMPHLSQVEADMQKVLGFVDFNEGHRYTDFDASVDEVAAYGIGALIAGKVAAKAGLFKVLLGLLVAGKKFAVIALVALGALLKKMWAKFSGRDVETS